MNEGELIRLSESLDKSLTRVYNPIIRFERWMMTSRSPMRQEVQSIFLARHLSEDLLIECPGCGLLSQPHVHRLSNLPGFSLTMIDFWPSLEKEGY